MDHGGRRKGRGGRESGEPDSLGPEDVFGPPPGLVEWPWRLEYVRMTSWSTLGDLPRTLVVHGRNGEPCRLQLGGWRRGASSLSEATDGGQQQTIEERLTSELAHGIRLLAETGLRSTANSSWQERSKVTEDHGGEGTEEQCSGGVTEERGDDCTAEGELTGEHRRELAELSQALSNAVARDHRDFFWFESLAEQAAYTIVRLETLASHGDGARRAVHTAGLAMQNILALVCAFGLTPEELRLQGMPPAMKVRLASVCRKFFFDVEHIISRVGVAKHRLFTDNVKFRRRRRKSKDHRVRT